ncbi:hypothetical protein HN859_03010 [Candidatus Parcubacteria bacterium]|jgi:hypothetical protein|nr:hypothetical protein [Candidatus Parcubacteria bacterium]
MKQTKSEMKIWRFLANFWGLFTAIFFVLNFLKIFDLDQALKTLAVIYISVLSIFTGIKEYNRWVAKKFLSRHNGEIFIILWTTLMVGFILFNAYDPDRYNISGEFTATYLSILGVFAISLKSKNLKQR